MNIQQHVVLGLHTVVLVAHHALFQMLPVVPERADLPKCVQDELQVVSCLLQLGGASLIATEPLRAWIYGSPIGSASLWSWGGTNLLRRRPLPKAKTGETPPLMHDEVINDQEHAATEAAATQSALDAQRLWSH